MGGINDVVPYRSAAWPGAGNRRIPSHFQLRPPGAASEYIQCGGSGSAVRRAAAPGDPDGRGGRLRGGFGLIGIGPDKGRTTRKNFNRRRMALFLIIGSLPLVLAMLVKDYVEIMYHSTALVSLTLMINGLILFFSDRFSRGTRTLQDARGFHALAVGLAQVLAVVPGLSRSGTTISMGMVCGFKRSFAVQFSFLLSVPAVLGATVVSIYNAASAGIDPAMLPRYLCGMAASAVSGYFSIRLLRYLAAHNYFGGFAYYCWGAGLIALVLSLIA